MGFTQKTPETQRKNLNIITLSIDLNVVFIIIIVTKPRILNENFGI